MKEKIVLLPTDNRPVTYIFPQQICELAKLKVAVPPRNFMGSLQAPTDLNKLMRWLKEETDGANALLLCLDTLLYGGLIPSRRSNDSLDTVLERAAAIASLKKKLGQNVKIYAQSSIMRISNNYDNTEEKLYWSELGQEIYNWSQLLHKKELGLLKSENELKTVETSISPTVREDYLATRERNFSVNKKLIDYVVSGDFDFLIFSQDDSGQYGLNVSERDKLISIAKDKGTKNILAYPGADEMLMTLIARYLNDKANVKPRTNLSFSAIAGPEIMSNFEGQAIGKSMKNQIEAQGLVLVESGSKYDFEIIAHTGLNKQGDHIWLPGLEDLKVVETKESALRAVQLIEEAKAPVIICDIAYSNGADPLLIDLLLAKPALFDKIWAYAGWNTTGNTVGCALAFGAACLYAKNNGGLDNNLRKQLLFLRLMDDYAYQTQVRAQIRLDEKKSDQQKQSDLNRLMDIQAKKLAVALKIKPDAIQYSFPWQRTFEVEVELKNLSATVLP